MARQALRLDPIELVQNEMREADHRVANSLSLAAALLGMQRRQSTDEAVRNAVLSAESRIASIASFHHYLFRNGGGERVDLVEYLREVLPRIGEAIDVRCMFVVDTSGPIELSARAARSLTLIVNELAVNARKHGYGGREGGCVTVELSTDGAHGLTLHVADGGSGLPHGFDPEGCKGLGMRIVHSLIRDIGGSLSSHTDGGARFTISIPQS